MLQFEIVPGIMHKAGAVLERITFSAKASWIPTDSWGLNARWGS
jgi:hypothetical protein